MQAVEMRMKKIIALGDEVIHHQQWDCRLGNLYSNWHTEKTCSRHVIA